MAPTNGDITYSSVDANARAVDSTATYSCMTGFTLTGNMIRTCQSDGKWNGTDPTCDGNELFNIPMYMSAIHILEWSNVIVLSSPT